MSTNASAVVADRVPVVARCVRLELMPGKVVAKDVSSTRHAQNVMHKYSGGPADLVYEPLRQVVRRKPELRLHLQLADGTCGVAWITAHFRNKPTRTGALAISRVYLPCIEANMPQSVRVQPRTAQKSGQLYFIVVDDEAMSTWCDRACASWVPKTTQE